MNKFFKTFKISIFCLFFTTLLLPSITVDPTIRHAAMAHIYAKTEYQEGFTEHTKIKTSHGYQSISTLRSNDFIDATENSSNNQKVVLTENVYIPYYFEIKSSNGSIQAAPAQQFYDEYLAQWIQAKNLTTNHHLGKHQIINVAKIQKYTHVYRINTSDHVFMIDGDIKVHNVDLATACDIGLIIGQIVIQHPVLKFIRTGISLARFAFRLQTQMLLAQQYEIEELNNSMHENNIIEIRNYYENKRTQLLKMLAQYQAMKNITETISKRSALGSSLFANITPYQSNISLLPALSVELKYNAADQQKLLTARQQDLANIEQKIISIQISIAIYVNEIISSYYQQFSYIDNLVEESDKITELWDPKYQDTYSLQDLMYLTYKNTIFLDYCIQRLERTIQELSCLTTLYTQDAQTLLLQQSSNIRDVCNQVQQHILQTQHYVSSLKISITNSYQMNNELLKTCPVLSKATIQLFIHQAQQHLNEQEQQHKANISIKQSQTHYPASPSDPDPDDDEEKIKKFDHTNHPHDDTKNKFPPKDPHGLRNAQGHLSDTPEHRLQLLNTCKNRDNRVALDRHGNMWYAKNEPDGSQLWISVRLKTSEIQNCGLNKAPRPVDPNTGLCKSLRLTKGKK